MPSNDQHAIVATDAEPDKPVEIALEINERYRSRARSMSTLTAAATAALSAGLVLAPSDSIPFNAQVFGLASVVALIGATCLFVASSVTYSEEPGKARGSRILRGMSLWHVHNTGAGETSGGARTASVGQRLTQAAKLRSRIALLMDIGIWVAFSAVVALVAALLFATFRPVSTVEVSVLLLSDSTYPDCPRLTSEFRASVGQDVLEGSSPYLPVAVSAKTCGSCSDKTLYLPRDAIAIARTSPQ